MQKLNILAVIFAASLFTNTAQANVVIDKVVETKLALTQGVEDAKSDLNKSKEDFINLFNKVKGFAITSKDFVVEVSENLNEEAQH